MKVKNHQLASRAMSRPTFRRFIPRLRRPLNALDAIAYMPAEHRPTREQRKMNPDPPAHWLKYKNSHGIELTRSCPTPDVPRDTSFAATLHNRQWVEDLHRIRSSVETANRTDHQFVASAAIAVTTLSSGFIFWLLRGGLLLSSLMMSLPAWASLDPLPILAYRNRKNRKEERHEDKVERMF